ncbi:MAG: hypothetical protein KDC84_16175 [Crocinitomicaceae bacterium]|nr:hypothetical protein [Crocinitomicaceae bacterium]
MKLILTLVLVYSSTLLSQNPSLSHFQSEADSAGLVFTMPEGFEITDVKENKDLYYSFAIINADKSMEIRYTIWSLNEMFEVYEASLKDSNVTMVNPNNMYYARVQANMMNMTGGQIYNIGAFPDEAVKREFNADKGGACFFEFNCEFGEDWVYGQFIYLHKDDVADVIITFMSKDADRHSDLMSPAFHALKFKSED